MPQHHRGGIRKRSGNRHRNDRNAGGGNGNNNSDNNNNSRSHGNNNNRNKSRDNSRNGRASRHCDNCGTNPTHDTAQCFFSNNQNDRGNQTHNRKQNDNSIGSPLCGKCERRGHHSNQCKAVKVSEEDRCPCGNTYHTPARCHFKGDPEERDRQLGRPVGKICSWCKVDGDGRHTLEDCTYVNVFRNEMWKILYEPYKRYKWCYHCTADDHITKACETTQARQKTKEWERKINLIIDVEVERADPITPARDGLGDVPMFEDIVTRTGPPSAHEFEWCIFCENFDVVALRRHGRDKCSTQEFVARMPAKFRAAAERVQPQVYQPNAQPPPILHQPVVHQLPVHQPVIHQLPVHQPQVYQPQGTHHMMTRSKTRNQYRTPSPPVDQWGDILVLCPTHNCGNHVIFDLGTSNEDGYCEKCRRMMPNPFRDMNQKFLHELSEMGMEDLERALQDKYPQLAGKLIAEKKQHIGYSRPSVWLPKHEIALDKWPETQPIYRDVQIQDPQSHQWVSIFRDGGNYFNYPGNFQPYFPPTLVKLSSWHLEMANNDNTHINKAGRRGLEFVCVGCKTTSIVRDEEDDVVMCNTDPAFTLGCGTGKVEFCNPWDKRTCKCLRTLLQDPQKLGYWVWRCPE